MSCFHCGLAVTHAGPHRSFLLGAEREFCCAGCEAVARTIVDGGFETYYRTRTFPAPRPRANEAEDYPDATGSASLILEGLRCGACSWLIEQVLRGQGGVTSADVNYATQRARVVWDPAHTSLRSLIEAIRAVGYDATPYNPQRQEEVYRLERRSALWRLFIPGFGAMQVMMYAFPAYISDRELSSEANAMMRWASLLVPLPVLIFACRPFFAGAWRE